MSEDLKQQFLEDLRELNQANRNNLMVLVGVLWFVSTALFGWIASDWGKRMDEGDARDKQLVERQSKMDTDVALLKSVDVAHERQLDALTRSTEAIQRSHSDLIQQMTEVRVSVTTIKETTRTTSDRLEGLTKFLRDGGAKGILDTTDHRRYREDLP